MDRRITRQWTPRSEEAQDDVPSLARQLRAATVSARHSPAPTPNSTRRYPSATISSSSGTSTSSEPSAPGSPLISPASASSRLTAVSGSTTSSRAISASSALSAASAYHTLPVATPSPHSFPDVLPVSSYDLSIDPLAELDPTLSTATVDYSAPYDRLRLRAKSVNILNPQNTNDVEKDSPVIAVRYNNGNVHRFQRPNESPIHLWPHNAAKLDMRRWLPGPERNCDRWSTALYYRIEGEGGKNKPGPEVEGDNERAVWHSFMYTRADLVCEIATRSNWPTVIVDWLGPDVDTFEYPNHRVPGPITCSSCLYCMASQRIGTACGVAGKMLYPLGKAHYKLPAALEKERTAKSRLRKHVWPRLLNANCWYRSQMSNASKMATLMNASPLSIKSEPGMLRHETYYNSPRYHHPDHQHQHDQHNHRDYQESDQYRERHDWRAERDQYHPHHLAPPRYEAGPMTVFMARHDPPPPPPPPNNNNSNNSNNNNNRKPDYNRSSSHSNADDVNALEDPYRPRRFPVPLNLAPLRTSPAAAGVGGDQQEEEGVKPDVSGHSGGVNANAIGSGTGAAVGSARGERVRLRSEDLLGDDGYRSVRRPRVVESTAGRPPTEEERIMAENRWLRSEHFEMRLEVQEFNRIRRAQEDEILMLRSMLEKTRIQQEVRRLNEIQPHQETHPHHAARSNRIIRNEQLHHPSTLAPSASSARYRQHDRSPTGNEASGSGSGSGSASRAPGSSANANAQGRQRVMDIREFMSDDRDDDGEEQHVGRARRAGRGQERREDEERGQRRR